MSVDNQVKQHNENVVNSPVKLEFSSLADQIIKKFQTAVPEEREVIAVESEKMIGTSAIDLIETAAKRFSDKPCTDTATRFIRDIAMIKNKLDRLGLVSADESMICRITSNAATEIGNKVIAFWENVIFPDYDQCEEYPSNDQWLKFVDVSSYCTVLIERAIDLSNDEASRANVERYVALCKIHDSCINSCGWSFDMHGSNVNITNTFGRAWHKDRCLADKEIKERQKRIAEYTKKMTKLRRIIADRQCEQGEEEQKRYWEEHSEEYLKYLKENQNDTIRCREFIKEGEKHLAEDELLQAALAFWRGGEFERSRDVFDFSTLIGAGQSHTVGVMPDGKVITAGDGCDGNGTDMHVCNTGSWKNIVAVAASNFTTIGLKRDGKIVSTGMNSNGQMNLGAWREIRKITASSRHTVALRADGFVLAEGDDSSSQCKTYKWTNVKSISAGRYHTMALLNNGDVTVCGATNHGRADTSDWHNIVMIAAGGGHSVGLCADGRVVACGQNDMGQCNTEEWHDIVAIGAGSLHTVGVRSDGTVVACGANDRRQCNVGDWSKVIAVACGNHTVGLCWDGSVLCAGDNIHHQNEVCNWNLFLEQASKRRKQLDIEAAPLNERLNRLKDNYRKLKFYQRGQKKQVWLEITELEHQIENLS